VPYHALLVQSPPWVDNSDASWVPVRWPQFPIASEI
jgi:hypothetical protein